MLDAGYWILDTGCWMLDSGCRIVDAGGWRMERADYLLSDDNDIFFIADLQHERSVLI